eukprot:m.243762 g.243762  ORF g.243762 m.243762 type:complete len:227 (+) comp40239_c1_seq4:1664-2344(+)
MCDCPAGYLGMCNETCPLNFYGYKCTEACLCQNGGACDPVDGSCICSGHWVGKFCEKACPDWMYDPLSGCQKTCRCFRNNSRRCDNYSGRCFCSIGWAGERCDYHCPDSTYGLDCKETCKCKNDADCNPFNGNCTCKPGYNGTFCENQCPVDTFGFYASRVVSASTMESALTWMALATVLPAGKAKSAQFNAPITHMAQTALNHVSVRIKLPAIQCLDLALALRAT